MPAMVSEMVFLTLTDHGEESIITIGTNMKRLTVFLAIVSLSSLGTGCQKQEQVSSPLTGNQVQSGASFPAQFSTREIQEPLKPDAKRLSPLEYAQKEYLDAYNDYVRLLRESGPQTIDTLQALAMYQKKYQIYQMLLKAEGEKKN